MSMGMSYYLYKYIPMLHAGTANELLVWDGRHTLLKIREGIQCRLTPVSFVSVFLWATSILSFLPVMYGDMESMDDGHTVWTRAVLPLLLMQRVDVRARGRGGRDQALPTIMTAHPTEPWMAA